VTARPRPHHGWLAHARLLGRWGYVVILLVATLTPFVSDPSPVDISYRIDRVFHPNLRSRDIVDAARNVVLFAGWGAVWALTAGASSLRRVVALGTLTGAAISAVVEFAQLFSSNRTSSLVDVATNTAGALAGTIGLLVIAALSNQRRGARSFVGLPTVFFAASYGTSAWLEALVPLLRDKPIAVGNPIIRMAGVLREFRFDSVIDVPWGDAFLFIPAGALALAALVEHGLAYPDARHRVMLGGVVLAGAAELLHGFTGQPIVLGSILLHAGAVALGAWACARWLPGFTVKVRGADRPRILLLAYAAVLGAWAWRPYLAETEFASIAQKFQADWYVPLAALAMRQDLFSVIDVCNSFFLYLPLGALLAVWPVRRRGPWSGPWPGVWLALVLEASQVVILERMLDVTDFMVAACGVLVGWAILRRASYRPYGETFPVGWTGK
jgi:VanZ family protein